jgi:hypothetical protein
MLETVGKSLRDKEFRYLRTVIVTAAVYRGFDSELAPLLLTFRHRAGVRPYTSPCGFAEPCVFVKQSPPPSLCPPRTVARTRGPLLPKLRGQFAEFLQHRSLKRLGMLYQSTCVGFGYGLMRRLFPGTLQQPGKSDNPELHFGFVTFRWPTNINVVPIDYAFLPRLRGRLTLRRLALRRNPWTFGDSVSHTVFVTHVSIRSSDTSRCPHGSSFTGLRNAPLPRAFAHPQLRYVA